MELGSQWLKCCDRTDTLVTKWLFNLEVTPLFLQIQTHVDRWPAGMARYDAFSFSIDRTTLQSTLPLFLSSSRQPFMKFEGPLVLSPMHVYLRLARSLPTTSGGTKVPVVIEFTVASCDLYFGDMIVQRGSRSMRWIGSNNGGGGGGCGDQGSEPSIAFQGEYWTKRPGVEGRRGLLIDRTRFLVGEEGVIGYENVGSDPELVEEAQYLLCGVQFSEVTVGIGRLIKALDNLR